MHPVDAIVRSIVTPHGLKNKGLYKCSGVVMGEDRGRTQAQGRAEMLSVMNAQEYRESLRAVLDCP